MDDNDVREQRGSKSNTHEVDCTAHIAQVMANLTALGVTDLGCLASGGTSHPVPGSDSTGIAELFFNAE